MKIPTLHGIIRRRILVNYRVDPRVIQAQLPARFRPKLHAGMAIAGICLIRLEQIRPDHFPGIVGLRSENAAHRIAVVWDDATGTEREGVFVPRRDTNSPINYLLGGRLFPGEHHAASFNVREWGDEIDLKMKSQDGCVAVSLKGKIAEELPRDSIFHSLADASAFFEPGSLGYSVTKDSARLDGITLKTKEWIVAPLTLERIHSSYFADAAKFPASSVEFDHALIMRDIAHEWHSASELYI